LFAKFQAAESCAEDHYVRLFVCRHEIIFDEFIQNAIQIETNNGISTADKHRWDKLTRIFHSWIEQRSGEGVKRVDITHPNENTAHRFFCDRL